MENLVTTNVLEFVRTYLYDFVFNNSQIIKRMDLGGYIEDIEKSAIYYSKLILHFEYFYKYRYVTLTQSFTKCYWMYFKWL